MPVLTVTAGTVLELPGNQGRSIHITVHECGETAGFYWARVAVHHPTFQSQCHDSLELSEEDEPHRIGYGVMLSVRAPREAEDGAPVAALRFHNGRCDEVKYFEPEENTRSRRRKSKSQNSERSPNRPPDRPKKRRGPIDPANKPGLKSKWARQLRDAEEEQ